MSPALLNKYLQAAREVANHMVLTPDGFDFSPTPMLVETDREKYAILRIVNFYESQPTDYADYFQAAWRFKHRAELGKPGDTLAGIAADAKVSAKYLPDGLGHSGRHGQRGRPGREIAGHVALAAGAAGATTPSNSARNASRCAISWSRIRQHTAMQFAAPVVRGLPAGSQPLLNWKLLQFNSHRRNSDPKALRNDTDPPPVEPTIPRYAGLHQEGAPRWAALMAKARMDDTDLVVPAAERPRYEAAFERLASVFPDVFYVQRARPFLPRRFAGQGPSAQRRLSQRDGLLARRHAADGTDSRRKGPEAAQSPLGRIRFHQRPHRTAPGCSIYFNQSGEVLGKGAESGFERPSDKNVSTPEIIFKLRDLYLAKAEASNNPVAVRGHQASLPVGQRHPAADGADARGCGAAAHRGAA